MFNQKSFFCFCFSRCSELHTTGTTLAQNHIAYRTILKYINSIHNFNGKSYCYMLSSYVTISSIPFQISTINKHNKINAVTKMKYGISILSSQNQKILKGGCRLNFQWNLSLSSDHQMEKNAAWIAQAISTTVHVCCLKLKTSLWALFPLSNVEFNTAKQCGLKTFHFNNRIFVSTFKIVILMYQKFGLMYLKFVSMI